MKIINALILTVLFCIVSIDTSAAHLAGGSIRYDYIGVGATSGTYKYKVSATVIRYCRGIAYSTTQLAQEAFWFKCAATGTTLGPFTASLVPYVSKPGERTNARGARDISDVCRSTQTACELSSVSGAKGYEAFIVEYTIDLPRCNSWEVRLVTNDCCRNPAGNCGTSPGNVGLETNINTGWSPWNDSSAAPENSAPAFADAVKPMPSACTGQNVFYGVGSVDPDGDSLRYELTCPWGANAGSGGANSSNPFNTMVKLTPIAPYSCTKPIDNFVLDSATGMMSFRTNVSSQYIVAFYVYEYERCTGILKGKTYREIQFTVDPCSNNVPKDISGISNLQGNAQKLGKYSLEVCEGEVISWEDTIYDKDVLDTLFFASNVDSILEGVTFTTQSLARNSALIKFSWRAKLAEGQYKTFFVAFDDDRCDFPGNGYSVFDIKVNPSADTGPDQFICNGDTAKLDALGGEHFTWHVISGDPIINGVNWFPDTTTNDTNRTVSFLPTKTTKLWVEVDTLKDACGNSTSGKCFNTDTVIINVVDSFKISTQPVISVCDPGYGQLNVSISKPNLVNTINWTPSINLDYDSIQNPQFSNVHDTISYQVIVTSDSGCIRKATSRIEIIQPFPQNMQIVSSDTLVCLSKTVNLWVNNGSNLNSSLLVYDWGPKATGNFLGSTNNDSAQINVNLLTPKKYFVYVEDSTSGTCKDTLEVDIKVVSKYNTIPDSIGVQCFSSKLLKLSSPTPYNITSPGGKWTGVGIVNDSLGIWDPSLSGKGKFPVTYSITGNSCASSGIDTIELVGFPNASFATEFTDSVCGYYNDTLKSRLIPKINGGMFRGYGVDSVVNASGEMIYFINGSLFTPSTNTPSITSVTYEVEYGCIGDSTQNVQIIAEWDSTFQGTLDNGSVYFTNSFCMSSDYTDTLVVKGKNPSWLFPSNPAAVIDTKQGIFDPKLASVGQTTDFVANLIVSNSGFCGTSDTIPIQFVSAPEIEVVDKVYCSDWVLDSSNKLVVDTVMLRLPKGPSIGGTGGKKIGEPGNDIEVNYASISQTGWPNSYDLVQDQFSYNYWQGNPWMNFRNIATFRPSSLKIGSSNLIVYNYAMLYRSGHPNKKLCFSRDTGYVEVKSPLLQELKATHQMCEQEPVILDAGHSGSKYLWSNGDTTQTTTVNSFGVYTVTVTDLYCSTFFTTKVTWCTNVESHLNEGMEVSLFPNPASSNLNLIASGLQGSELLVVITDLTGKRIHSGTISREEATSGFQIDVSELSSGVYMLSVSEGENYSTYRIVVE
ncbi:MAG: T9SS type A sorting domain-containing protein [Salibacteraceae bacterium]